MERPPRIGRFQIETRMIERQPDLAQAVMALCIPIRAELMWSRNAVVYEAISDRFDICPPGRTIPEYDVSFVRSPEGAGRPPIVTFVPRGL